MSDTKVRLIEADSPKDLMDKMNADKEERFASQIMVWEGKFVAFLFYVGEERKKDFKGKLKDPDSPATDAQKYRLKKEGFKEDLDSITKREASMAISEIESKQKA